ncbi:MAG: enoyl-CoA hydratase-related protein [Rhodothermales bacterium]
MISLSLTAPIATLTLNRPEKLNALTMEMLHQLEAHIAALEEAKDVRVVLLTAAGERAFCVGADIHAWAALGPQDMWRTWIRVGHRIFDRLAALRMPVIAVLNGFTFGGGLELALAADIRLAAEEAAFALPEVGLGTVPGWAGTQRLPAVVGVGRAKQMIFAGERISATKAEAWGLVNEVHPRENLLARAQELAETIAQKAPLAVQMTKQLVDGGLGRNAGVTLESLASGLVGSSEDAAEGLAAFREKREARFKGV